MVDGFWMKYKKTGEGDEPDGEFNCMYKPGEHCL